MIKGVNKQILEVTNTDSPYFEKIIFFVRPKAQQKSSTYLQKEAEKIALEVHKPPKTRRTSSQIKKFIFNISLGLGAGVALTFILSSVI